MSDELALRNLAKRTGIIEIRIFVVALLVQSRCGGDLIKMLANLTEMIRKRLKLKRRVRAMTGENRLQAVILIVLPILAFAGLSILAPDYVSELLKRPWLLTLTATAQLLGALWIRHYINFEY